ncbi:MAG: hypothetical protein IT276_00695 [Ignavibacteriaceae bacterium]|nr:hypothetical protein [Ignavibacteriaceae bacterium]
MVLITQADRILNEVYKTLHIDTADEITKYQNIENIVIQLQTINQTGTIDVKTTGTISERLCELALRSVVPGIYNVLGKDWKWIGDFSVLGNPFNLIISVKSFKAKERLMASGSGNILSPTIGWGLFNDPSEWTENRIKGYLFRAFIGIYMPIILLNALPQESRDILNINGKPFLRSVNTFSDDLQNALTNNKIDITKI